MQIDKKRCRRKDQDLPANIKHSKTRLVLNVSYNIFQQTHGTLSQISSSACGQHPATPPDLGVYPIESTRDASSAYRSRHMPRTSCRCSMKIKGPAEVGVQYLTRRRERTFLVMDLWMARTRGMCRREDMERHAK
jgi:hypothetical protein